MKTEAAARSKGKSGIIKRIYSLCQGEGLTEKQLLKAMKGHRDTLKTARELVEKRILQLLKDTVTNELIYQSLSQDIIKNKTFKNMTEREYSIHQLIDMAKDNGVSFTELKKASQMQPTELKTILKRLEEYKFIKAIKSIKSKQRVYLLFGVKPSREITGGIWYINQQYNTTFIDTLRGIASKYLLEKGHASLSNILEYVHQQGLDASVKLNAEDMKQIMDTLKYGGLVEKIITNTGGQYGEDPSDEHYQIVKGLMNSNAFTDIPCGTCPRFSVCDEGAFTNPENCKYLQDWVNW